MDGMRDESRFHLLDASAIIIGYAVASLLVRACWPRSQSPPVWALFLIGFVYLWLGLAMSGPVVLLTRRPVARPEEADEGETVPRTWAELAWMIIGIYWIGLTVLVVPLRVPGSRFIDSAVLGLFPVVGALGLRIFRTHRSVERGRPSWTHHAGVALLLTWPVAWLGLILLGKAFS